MRSWYNLAVGDKVIFSWDDFDGDGRTECVVTETFKDHVIAKDSDMSYWIDEENSYMFRRA